VRIIFYNISRLSVLQRFEPTHFVELVVLFEEFVVEFVVVELALRHFYIRIPYGLFFKRLLYINI
jgi:hypothetical protein